MQILILFRTFEVKTKFIASTPWKNYQKYHKKKEIKSIKNKNVFKGKNRKNYSNCYKI